MIDLRLVVGQEHRLKRLHDALVVVLIVRRPRLTLTVARERHVVDERLQRAVLEAVDFRARHLNVLVAVGEARVDLILAHLECIQVGRLETNLKRVAISSYYVLKKLN